MWPLGKRTMRLSRFGPPAFLIAVTMAPGVTEPNSLPESPAVFTGSATEPSALIAVLISLACSRSRTCLESRARRMSSTCFSAPRDATIARPRGSRKLRPYPSLTSTVSPTPPRWSTSAVKMSFIVSLIPFCVSRLPRRGGEGQQRHLAGVLDRDRDVALVLNAVAGDAAGTDLAALADVGTQQLGVLVIDVLALFGAEHALACLDRLFRRRAPLGGLRHLCLFRSVVEKLLEGGLVVAPRERTRCRGAAPRGFARRAAAAALGRWTGSPTAAAAETTTAAAAAAGFVNLGGGVLQARADLVDLELDHSALLALTGLERTLLEPSAHDHARAAGQALGHVLGSLPPDAAAEEQRFAVLPLVGLTVEHAGRRRDGEVRDGRARRREPQFGVRGQVSDDCDDGVTSHNVLLGPPCIGGWWSQACCRREPTQRPRRVAVIRPQAPAAVDCPTSPHRASRSASTSGASACPCASPWCAAPTRSG